MNRTKAREFQKFLIRVRQLEGDMTTQRLNVLLEVYLNDSIDQTSLVRKAHLSTSSASKNIAAWTTLDAYKKKAPGYIKSTPDPMNLENTDTRTH